MKDIIREEFLAIVILIVIGLLVFFVWPSTDNVWALYSFKEQSYLYQISLPVDGGKEECMAHAMNLLTDRAYGPFLDLFYEVFKVPEGASFSGVACYDTDPIAQKMALEEGYHVLKTEENIRLLYSAEFEAY